MCTVVSINVSEEGVLEEEVAVAPCVQQQWEEVGEEEEFLWTQIVQVAEEVVAALYGQ